MDEKVNRKGVILFQLLAGITFFPSGLAMKQIWLGWVMAVIICSVVFLIFSESHLQLIDQRLAYFQTQLVGLIGGLVVLFYPDTKILCVFLWFIFVFFRYINLWDKKLFIYLSK